MQRSELISFYEELGVSKTASQEEIRDAFRSLVRLLHPDHQTDEQLKVIAGAQLRKINRIYAVLSDPERRRRYDDYLEEDPAPTIVFNPASNINVRRLVQRTLWVLAACVTAVVLGWIASDGPDSPQLARQVRQNRSGRGRDAGGSKFRR